MGKGDRYERQTNAQNISDVARALEVFESNRAVIANGNRIRVSLARTLLATRFAYDEQGLIYATLENVNGSVDYNAQRDSATLNIGAAAGDKLVRQTNEYFHYQSYRESHFGAGILPPPHQDGQRWRAGSFFTEDGIFIEKDTDGTLYAVRRSNATGTPTDERVPQSEWNVDRMNGSDHPLTNPSNIDLDLNKVQMIKGGFEWYAGGDAWLGFKIGGIVYVVHRFDAGNRLAEPLFGEPTLPIRYEIENVNAVSTAEGLETFGASFSAEAADNESDTGFVYSTSRGRNGISVNNTLTRVLTIRPKETFKGKTNRTKVELQQFGIFATNNDIHFELVRDAPFTDGGDWAAPAPDSAVEYSLASTGGGGQGTQRINDYAQAGQATGKGQGTVREVDPRYPLVLPADGLLGDVNLAVFAQTLPQNSSATVYASMRWLEIQ